MFPGLGAVAVGIAVIAGAEAPGAADDAPTALTRAAAAEVLKKGLEEADRAEAPGEKVEILRRAAEAASKGRPENILAVEALRGPAESPESDAGQLAEGWRRAIGDAVEILEFEILKESPLPEGFPDPPPLGEITIQKYPVYRSARAEIRDAGDNGAFMRLFGHITTKGISMTVPVEMNYAPDEGQGEGEAKEGKEGSRKVAMSFLYESTKQGTLGGDQVKVQDVGELTTVTLGLRGTATDERVEEAKGRLEAWLASHADEYRASGPVRTLIYNSPYAPEKRKFFEVQFPIEPAKPGEPAE